MRVRVARDMEGPRFGKAALGAVLCAMLASTGARALRAEPASITGVHAAPENVEASQPGEWSARAGTALELLDARWGREGDWQGAGGWQRFVLVDLLIAYRERSGDPRWDERIAKALRNRRGLALNDDALWAVIASVDGYRLEGDPELLDYAATRFAQLVTTYWDDTCGGGLWWDPRRSYKNAITNELLVTAATRLYRATGQESYRAWALRGWGWIAASGMIGDDALVRDGLAIDTRTRTCRSNGQPRWTYNQGVILSGLSDLTEMTGDPTYRARAVAMAGSALARLTHADGTLREPVPAIGADGLSFKGIFAFHLAYLMDALPEGAQKQALREAARRNAAAVWRISEEGRAPVDSDWTGAKRQFGAAAQGSGAAMLLAADR
ncbi:glycoside hydrolase family 76 protein [Novosphingobium aureum]|nr:glycoside hydrolase family 76 protein [Novosphingobium aureum]